MKSTNDGSARNTRHMSDSSMKRGKLMSELSARSRRSRRLMRGGVARRGRGLRARRCTGER